MSTPESDRVRLLALLHELSYEQRAVTLASGRTSNFYIDCRNTALHPEGIVLCGRELLRRLLASGPAFDAVAGPSVGADPLVSGVAYTSYLNGQSVPAILVRKEPKGHGLGRQLEGTRNLPAGARLAVVEDVFTSGGSALRTIKAIRAAGYQVVRVIALVDRQEGGLERVRDEADVPVEALYSKSDFTAESDFAAEFDCNADEAA